MKKIFLSAGALFLTISCESILPNPSIKTADAFLKEWQINGINAASRMVSPRFREVGFLGDYGIHGPQAFLKQYKSDSEFVVIKYDMSKAFAHTSKGIYSDNGQEWEEDLVQKISMTYKYKGFSGEWVFKQDDDSTITINKKDGLVVQVGS